MREVVAVAVAELVEPQIAVAAVCVQLDGFERIEQQRLAHDVKVGAKRVHYLHAILRLV